jgi:hypothetical protein
MSSCSLREYITAMCVLLENTRGRVDVHEKLIDSCKQICNTHLMQVIKTGDLKHLSTTFFTSPMKKSTVKNLTVCIIKSMRQAFFPRAQMYSCSRTAPILFICCKNPSSGNDFEASYVFVFFTRIYNSHVCTFREYSRKSRRA